MSTVVALHWNSSALQYVVARNGRVETYSTVALEPGLSPTSIGKKLADELSQQVSGRVKTIVALARNSLQWQHLALPPCPADELPDLVRLQSDREFGGDEDVGFDYLPLAGDEHSPYQVLTVGAGDAELNRVRQVCQEANLTLDRIVPLASGWPALAAQAKLDRSDAQVFVAPLKSEATLWGTQANRVVLFRQVQYATSEDPVPKQKVIESELRRTLLSLSQNPNFAKPSISLVSDAKHPLTALAQHLDHQLENKVQAVNLVESHTGLADMLTATDELLPLAGIALDESKSKVPLVDLLNPRRRPKAEINYRTYALAGVAATLLALMLGWTGYRNLNAPLEKAAEDRAAIALLEESREELAEFEQDAAAVRDWLAESPNLLVHLQHLSQTIRPESLKEDEFPLDRDVALQKLNLDKRQLVIDALARNDRAVQPFESRLRKANYSPERGRSGPSKQEGYVWQFQSIIEIDSESDLSAMKVTAGEPKDGRAAIAKDTDVEAEARGDEASDNEAPDTEEPQA